MLLIPFVENAFKHGISLEKRSWIRIGLECDDAKLSFTVRNSVNVVLVNDSQQGSSGIGLQNVRERLQLLYPGRYELHYGRQDDEFVVTLKININS
jgi:two-component system LytT family sensor kinase